MCIHFPTATQTPSPDSQNKISRSFRTWVWVCSITCQCFVLSLLLLVKMATKFDLIGKPGNTAIHYGARHYMSNLTFEPSRNARAQFHVTSATRRVCTDTRNRPIEALGQSGAVPWYRDPDEHKYHKQYVNERNHTYIEYNKCHKCVSMCDSKLPLILNIL